MKNLICNKCHKGLIEIDNYSQLPQNNFEISETIFTLDVSEIICLDCFEKNEENLCEDCEEIEKLKSLKDLIKRVLNEFPKIIAISNIISEDFDWIDSLNELQKEMEKI